MENILESTSQFPDIGSIRLSYTQRPNAYMKEKRGSTPAVYSQSTNAILNPELINQELTRLINDDQIALALMQRNNDLKQDHRLYRGEQLEKTEDEYHRQYDMTPNNDIFQPKNKSTDSLWNSGDMLDSCAVREGLVSKVKQPISTKKNSYVNDAHDRNDHRSLNCNSDEMIDHRKIEDSMSRANYENELRNSHEIFASPSDRKDVHMTNYSSENLAISRHTAPKYKMDSAQRVRHSSYDDRAVLASSQAKKPNELSEYKYYHRDNDMQKHCARKKLSLSSYDSLHGACLIDASYKTDPAHRRSRGRHCKRISHYPYCQHLQCEQSHVNPVYGYQASSDDHRGKSYHCDESVYGRHAKCGAPIRHAFPTIAQQPSGNVLYRHTMPEKGSVGLTQKQTYALNRQNCNNGGLDDSSAEVIDRGNFERPIKSSNFCDMYDRDLKKANKLYQSAQFESCAKRNCEAFGKESFLYSNRPNAYNTFETNSYVLPMSRISPSRFPKLDENHEVSEDELIVWDSNIHDACRLYETQLELYCGFIGIQTVFIFASFVFSNYAGGVLGLFGFVSAIYSHIDRRCASYVLTAAVITLSSAVLTLSVSTGIHGFGPFKDDATLRAITIGNIPLTVIFVVQNLLLAYQHCHRSCDVVPSSSPVGVLNARK